MTAAANKSVPALSIKKSALEDLIALHLLCRQMVSESIGSFLCALYARCSKMKCKFQIDNFS
jgi:hypothetical protein